MADTVRYMMEEMVPELEDLVKQRYFSRQEVKQIVKRRQDFEYLLKRRAALKEDYLRYIEYESKLEELRHHRAMALHPGGKKKTLADYAIVRRIHFIFERALRRFRSDVSLWTAWLEYCRASNSNRRLGRVVGRALQVHPTEPGLWVYAAAWEFEVNGNPSAARALMQQGLRMCRHSEKMWLDYFDMELMYAEKLVARRQILGLDDDAEAEDTQEQQHQQQQQDGQAAAATAAAGRKRQRQEAGSTADAAEQPGVAAAAPGGDDGEGPEEAAEVAAAAAEAQENYLLQQQQEQQEDMDGEREAGTAAGEQQLPLSDPQAAIRAVLAGAVARLVFQSAIKAAVSSKAGGSSGSSSISISKAVSGGEPGGLGFRAGFLEVAGRYRSAGAEALRQEILDSISRDFPESPDAADLLARATCDPADLSAGEADVQAAVQHYARLLGLTTHDAAAAAAAAGTSARSKRQKRAALQQEINQQQAAAAADLPQEKKAQLYRMYCRYLDDRFQALTGHEGAVMEAAAVAQQLFKLCLQAHEAGAAADELYGRWEQLAEQLQQDKVALRAARLWCEALPSSPAAWSRRLALEAAALQRGSSKKAAGAGAGDSTQQLLALVQQALQAVPTAEAGQLWQQAFELAGSMPSQLKQLQQMLLDAVSRSAVRGPERGGMGAVAAAALATTWRLQGAAAAWKLWKQLLLLPPAGGDMFKAMIQQELAAAGGKEGAVAADAEQQEQERDVVMLSPDALQRVRGLYDAWAGNYGSSDPGVWVQYALFEQQQGKQGAGKVYWRAVKALDDPSAFIDQYRAQIGLI